MNRQHLYITTHWESVLLLLRLEITIEELVHSFSAVQSQKMIEDDTRTNDFTDVMLGLTKQLFMEITWSCSCSRMRYRGLEYSPAGSNYRRVFLKLHKLQLCCFYSRVKLLQKSANCNVNNELIKRFIDSIIS